MTYPTIQTLFVYFVESYQWKGVRIDFMPLLKNQCLHVMSNLNTSNVNVGDDNLDYESYSPTGICLAPFCSNAFTA